MSKHTFETEVSQLLHLIIHSLYSHKEIFLRELISNSSDALDRLKYLTLTDDAFKSMAFEPRIDITFDGDKKTMTISDNGIGMNEEELVANLGTIARSGTKQFLSTITGDAAKASNLIGQFGVGFYSAFMVAEKVEVLSRKAGDETACKWLSDGKGEYSIETAERENYGTTITLFLNDEGQEYSNRWNIESVVKKYSDHVAFPIFLHYEDTEYEGEGEDKIEKKIQKVEQINAASALWKRPKNEITEEEYNEFYKSLSHDSEDPLLYLHTKAEGTQEYTTLFFIPKQAPFDMYQADYRPGVKLYVKRVFIMDDSKELMPVYLRFLRGVIDSEDLPLNVSREILQQNRILRNITSASAKKVLSELKKLSENNASLYEEFIAQYNRPLKEGLYSDFANREALLDLVRYKSSERDGFVSLAEYKERMKEDQKAIYYITGGDEQRLKNSPLLEAYIKQGVEVLIMDDEVDEIIAPSIGKYQDIELKSVNRSGTSEDLKTDEDKKKEKDTEPVLEKVKKALGDRVKDVVASTRLSDSPSCVVADENDPTMQMQQMLKAMGQKDIPESTPILELNPDHEIILKLKDIDDEDLIKDVSELLLDQALLAEGAEIKDPLAMVKSLNKVLRKAL